MAQKSRLNIERHTAPDCGIISYQNSCQSRFPGVYLVFEVLEEREFQEMLAISYLVYGRVSCL